MLYNLESIRRFKNFFRIEGELLGFKFSYRRRQNSKCFYDFGLKYKLSGSLKNFVSLTSSFKNNLYLKSLYLKPEFVLNKFSIKKNKNLPNLVNFCFFYSNHFEKFTKFHYYKFYNTQVYMNFEKFINIPFEYFKGSNA
jgi:hypothetical protein